MPTITIEADDMNRLLAGEAVVTPNNLFRIRLDVSAIKVASQFPVSDEHVLKISFTRSQQMALADLLLEYAMLANKEKSDLTTEWVNVSTDPVTTTTIADLLNATISQGHYCELKERDIN